MVVNPERSVTRRDLLESAVHSISSRDIRAVTGGRWNAEASEMLQSELAVLDRLRYLILDQQNQLAFTSMLPVEILSKIFFLSVHQRAASESSNWLLGLASPERNSWPPAVRDDSWIPQITSIMQVCRSWREIALETAALWTHISPVFSCALQLERARSLPFSLHIEDVESWEAVRDFIRPRVLGLKTLNMSFEPNNFYSFAIKEAIAGASNLEHLILSAHSNVDLDEHEPGHHYLTSLGRPNVSQRDLFIAKEALGLKFLSIAHVSRVDLKYLQFPQLQYLYLMDLEHRPLISRLVFCLKQLPCLVGLRLVEVLPSPSSDEPSFFENPQSRVTLPHLEDLWLIEWGSADILWSSLRCAAFVQLLDVPATVRYTCECKLPDTEPLDTEHWDVRLTLKSILPPSVAYKHSGYRLHYTLEDKMPWGRIYFAESPNSGPRRFQPFPSVNLAVSQADHARNRDETTARIGFAMSSLWENRLLQEVVVVGSNLNSDFWFVLFTEHPELKCVCAQNSAVESLISFLGQTLAVQDGTPGIPLPFEELILENSDLSACSASQAWDIDDDPFGTRKLSSVLSKYLESRYEIGQALPRLVFQSCTGLTDGDILTFMAVVSEFLCY